jgi:predicted nucleotidyltransferase
MLPKTLEPLLPELISDPNTVGILLNGSHARGEAYPGSDVDLMVFLTPGESKPFETRELEGHTVEIHWRDLGKASMRLIERPMEVYRYLDAEILHDPDGQVAHLVRTASERYENYSLPSDELFTLSYWLESTEHKIWLARNAGDLPKAAFGAMTSSWRILEGLWAANNRPMPPSSLAWQHLKRLPKVPEQYNQLIDHLFMGSPKERVEAALDLIDWTLSQLESIQVLR